MALDPSVEQLIARGKEAFARNQYLAALGELQEAAARHPGFADVQNLIGLCLSLLGRPDEAVDAFRRATAANTGYVEAHLNLAITLNDLGRFDEARAEFQAASEADEEKAGGRFPSAAAARLANKHAELGDLYADAGSLDDALREYGRAVQLRPQFLDIRNKLARVLIEAGRAGEAADELREVVELRPAFAAARANLGLALFRLDRHDEAEAEWQRCLQQQPGSAQVAGYLGMLARRRGAGSEP
jgi:tetratricopeptide (TPR) repeat protein